MRKRSNRATGHSQRPSSRYKPDIDPEPKEEDVSLIFNEDEIPKLGLLEGRRTIDSQLDTLSDIDTKAASILRMNILLLGVVATGLSIAATSAGDLDGLSEIVLSGIVNEYSALGFALLFTSAATAGITYSSSNMRAGMSGNDLRNLMSSDYSDIKQMRGLVYSYANWIEYNKLENSKNTIWSTTTLLSLDYALISFALGLYHGLIRDVSYLEIIVAVFIAVLILHQTGLISQIKRYRQLRVK